MATQMQPTIIGIVDATFQKSYEDGLRWAKYGDMPELSDSIILAFVHDNILGEAFNPPLTDDMVRRHTAFLCGWLLGATKGVHHA